MISVLFIAFEFPPVSITGAHRSAKFAKYLRAGGIDPIVVTLAPADGAETFGAKVDDAMLRDLPDDLTVYALPAPRKRPAPTTRLGKFAMVFGRVQDPIADRLRPALMRALPQIRARHDLRAVYVSLPPFSAGELAMEVARELALPLVVDMRDGWSHWCATAFPSYAHWALVFRKERRLFDSATTVVTVTNQLADIFRNNHPHIARERFFVIPNGYDGDLDLPNQIAPLDHTERSITVGYVGSYYYTPSGREAAFTPMWRRPGHRKLHYQPVREDWLYRSPYFFFRAVAELRRREPQIGRRIRFVHVGQKPAWLDAMAAEHGLADVVTCRGVVPHSQVQPIARSFDALLCTSVKVEGGQDYALASKTFDYVSAGRALLGFVTPGSQREFLEASGLALIADADDLDQGVRSLAALVRGDFALRPNLPFLAGYHRKALALQMASVLQQAALGGPRSVAKADDVRDRGPSAQGLGDTVE